MKDEFAKMFSSYLHDHYDKEEAEMFLCKLANSSFDNSLEELYRFISCLRRSFLWKDETSEVNHESGVPI